MTKNMTVGNPAKLILFFTIPLLIGNLFQQLYNMADTLIVGRTIGVEALAAVGCTGSIKFLILGFTQGLTAGLSIVTAQRFGRYPDRRRDHRVSDGVERGARTADPYLNAHACQHHRRRVQLYCRHLRRHCGGRPL